MLANELYDYNVNHKETRTVIDTHIYSAEVVELAKQSSVKLEKNLPNINKQCLS